MSLRFFAHGASALSEKEAKRRKSDKAAKFLPPNFLFDFTQRSQFRCNLPHVNFFSTFQVVAGISVFFICTSVISFCLKTLPGLRVEFPPSLARPSSNLSDIFPAPMTTTTTLPTSITGGNFTATQRPLHGGGNLFNRYSVCAENSGKVYSVAS